MSSWIRRLDSSGKGPRVAVKDAIDVRGVPTTMGCRAVARVAQPAAADAACVAAMRQAGARIVGKTTLHELCYGVTGINPWFGTAVNPMDAALVPGGSSSGSAVVVATGQADLALGTDTGGSIRIPAACCGVAGLKTTWGRLPLTGVGPLAPSLDTLGLLARDTAGLVAAMALLEPDFTVAGKVRVVGRVRIADIRVAGAPSAPPGVERVLEDAVDTALAAWGVEVVPVQLPGWRAADAAFEPVIATEAWGADGPLAARDPDGIGPVVRRRVLEGAVLPADAYLVGLQTRERWQAQLAAVFAHVALLALPTMSIPVPRLDDPAAGRGMNLLTRAFNLAGTPALALPLGGPGLSLQLVAPLGGEELLCAAGLAVEAALARARHS